jgi:hypothetical protein
MKLKFSKKVQSLILPTEGEAAGTQPFEGSASIQALIREEWGTGAIAKDGSIAVWVSSIQSNALRAHASARLEVLDAALAACTTDEERKPYFGESSAWRALKKQIDAEAVPA